VDDRFWNLLVPGIVLAGMILFPAAGADQDQDRWENLMSSSNIIFPDPLDTPATPGIDTTLFTEGETYSPPATTDPTPYGLLSSSPARGYASAWAKQSSSSGSPGGVTTLVEFKQMVTASGNIQKFMFSASVVL